MRFFNRLTRWTLIAVYFLILVGGIVRSTGSGMGCPDWPKCFGQWVPPANIEELPDDYKDFYASYRHKKNERFARYLSALGFKETAHQILTDESIREEADFNPVKTWIEYINRLVGVMIGILIFAVAGYSLRLWKANRRLTLVAFFTLFLVGFQGWIGSFVVSTNLTPWTVTVHMFLALVIVYYLIYLVSRSSEKDFAEPGSSLFLWTSVCIVIVLIQILLGTQVREAIDRVAAQFSRNEWVENLGVSFLLHRSFSWLVLLVHVVLVVKLMKTQTSKGFPLIVILLILGTILSGTGMAYFAVPAVLQPVHLLLSCLVFGMHVFLLMELKQNRKIVVDKLI